MLVYTLFFFSTDHSFIRFTSQNIQKVVVSVIGITVDMLLDGTVDGADSLHALFAAADERMYENKKAR